MEQINLQTLAQDWRDRKVNSAQIIRLFGHNAGTFFLDAAECSPARLQRMVDMGRYTR